MSAPLPRYRVSLITWDLFQIVLEAAGEDAALVAAKAAYEQHGEGALRHMDSGIDGWTVDPE